MSCEVSSDSTLMPALTLARRASANEAGPRLALPSGWPSVPLPVWLSLVCIVLAFWTPAGRLLEFDRTAIAAGEWWRVATGHWVHWSADHLLWDLGVFAVLGVLCERRSRPRFLGCLLLASLLIPVAVWLALPTMATYRGLSGIDTALFALLAVFLVTEKYRQRQWGWMLTIVGLFVGLAGKIGFEIAGSSALFVDVEEAGFIPVPLAHVVGASVGILVAIVPFGRKDSSSARRDVTGDLSK